MRNCIKKDMSISAVAVAGREGKHLLFQNRFPGNVQSLFKAEFNVVKKNSVFLFCRRQIVLQFCHLVQKCRVSGRVSRNIEAEGILLPLLVQFEVGGGVEMFAAFVNPS